VKNFGGLGQALKLTDDVVQAEDDEIGVVLLWRGVVPRVPWLAAFSKNLSVLCQFLFPSAQHVLINP